MPAGRGADRRDGALLFRRGLGPGADRGHARRSGWLDLAQAQHPPPLLEFAHVLAPAWRESRQRGLVRRGAAFQRRHQFAQPMGARR